MNIRQLASLIDHGATVLLYLVAGLAAVGMTVAGLNAEALWTFIAGGAAVQGKSAAVSYLRRREHDG